MKSLSMGLMILVMGAMLINKAVYIHVHVLPDGSVVTHAHPFSKKSENGRQSGHQHSNLEFFLLDQLNLLIISAGVVLLVKNLSAGSRLMVQVSDPLLPSLLLFRPGRAPPSCI